MRPLAYESGQCKVANGPGQCLDGACRSPSQSQCNATVLMNVNVVLTAEICWNGIDDNEDGLIDREDPACWVCGDGYLDNEDYWIHLATHSPCTAGSPG